MERSIGRVRRLVVLGAGVVALAIAATSMVASVVAAPPDELPNPPLNVNVSNTPLEVTGSVGVEGPVTVNGTVGATQSGNWTVGATQSGNWNVGITGTPGVTSADTTTLLGSFAGTVNGGGAFTEAVSFADASKSRSVRVLTNCFAGGDCANITVRVYTVVNGRSYLVDQFPMQNFVVAGGVYDVIGTNISVQLLNSNPNPTENVGVAVFGRAN